VGDDVTPVGHVTSKFALLTITDMPLAAGILYNVVSIPLHETLYVLDPALAGVEIVTHEKDTDIGFNVLGLRADPPVSVELDKLCPNIIDDALGHTIFKSALVMITFIELVPEKIV